MIVKTFRPLGKHQIEKNYSILKELILSSHQSPERLQTPFGLPDVLVKVFVLPP